MGIPNGVHREAGLTIIDGKHNFIIYFNIIFSIQKL
jgi:hypothetical protein